MHSVKIMQTRNHDQILARKVAQSHPQADTCLHEYYAVNNLDGYSHYRDTPSHMNSQRLKQKNAFKRRKMRSDCNESGD